MLTLRIAGLLSIAVATAAFDVKAGQLSDPPLPRHKTHPEDFFYAQQTSLWIFFETPRDVIRREIGDTLDRLGFEIATFENQESGYLILKPMVFMAEFGYQTAAIPGTSASTEVELTVLVYPKSQGPGVTGTFDDFLHGRTLPGNVGQLRLDVLCDHEVAVAAGRKIFGEHKFLGSFEYSYPTPNNSVGSPKDFHLDMTASTWQGAGRPERMMFKVQADLSGLRDAPSRFSPELLYSAFPPEPNGDERQTPVGEHRRYDDSNFRAYVGDRAKSQITISYGPAQGAEPLKPVAPFGDGNPIPGSEQWPALMRDRMREMLSAGTVVGYLLYRTPPAEYETKPFAIEN